AADAGQALDRLRAGRFDVVLADYELPDQTGATMLSEASQSGVIGRATALIVTAHSQPEGVDGYDVILKPVHLDRLMAQVQGALQASGGSLAAPDAGREVVDLVLYVSAGSVASLHARRSMERL